MKDLKATLSLNKNGITLIALVITIIILLILASVTVNVILGKNGLFKTAKKAGESYQIAGIKETVEAEILALDIEKISKGETLTIEQALVEINQKGTFEEIDLNEKTGIIQGYIVTLGYNENGKVVIKDIQKDTGTRITVKTEPLGYTNQNVKIEIGVKPHGIKITNIEVPSEITKNEQGKYEVTKNGTYLIKATLNDGSVIEKEVIIASIDKLAPKKFTITAENTGKGFIIAANAEDTESTSTSACSGIDKYEYYLKKENDTEYTTYYTNEISKLDIGKYNIYAIAYDKAGNSICCEVITAEVKQILKFSKISAGKAHTLAIDTNDTLWAWGNNEYGQLGNGTSKNSNIPIKIMENVKEISACSESSFAIDNNGFLWGWGRDRYNQLGVGGIGVAYTPIQIMENVKKISSGSKHTLALDNDNNLWAWGG